MPFDESSFVYVQKKWRDIPPIQKRRAYALSHRSKTLFLSNWSRTTHTHIYKHTRYIYIPIFLLALFMMNSTKYDPIIFAVGSKNPAKLKAVRSVIIRLTATVTVTVTVSVAQILTMIII
jgi:hypothetical protein